MAKSMALVLTLSLFLSMHMEGVQATHCPSSDVNELMQIRIHLNATEQQAKAKKDRAARLAAQAASSGKKRVDQAFVDPIGAEQGAIASLKDKVISEEEVELRWETKDEADNYGYIVQRRPGRTKDWVTIASYEETAQLRTKGPSGGSYVYLDDTVKPGNWVYRIIDETSDGRSVVTQKLVEIETKEANQLTEFHMFHQMAADNGKMLSQLQDMSAHMRASFNVSHQMAIENHIMLSQLQDMSRDMHASFYNTSHRMVTENHKRASALTAQIRGPATASSSNTAAKQSIDLPNASNFNTFSDYVLASGFNFKTFLDHKGCDNGVDPWHGSKWVAKC